MLASIDEPSVSAQWTQYTVSFTALTSLTNISFAAIYPPGASGPTLDDVVITDQSGKSSSSPLPASAAGGAALLAGLFVAKIHAAIKLLPELIAYC